MTKIMKIFKYLSEVLYFMWGGGETEERSFEKSNSKSVYSVLRRIKEIFI